MCSQKVSNGFIGILAISAWKAPVGFSLSRLFDRRSGFETKRNLIKADHGLFYDLRPCVVSPLSDDPIVTLRGEMLWYLESLVMQLDAGYRVQISDLGPI
jgi:hypothetical protein